MMLVPPRTVSQLAVEPLLKAKGFKPGYLYGHFTRDRWWKFWNMPNGGDLLIIGQYAWSYSGANMVSGPSGFSTASLQEFLETL